MPPAPEGESGTTVAGDSAVLALEAISAFFVNRARDQGPRFTWRHGLIAAHVGHRGRSASTPHPGTGGQATAHQRRSDVAPPAGTGAPSGADSPRAGRRRVR